MKCLAFPLLLMCCRCGPLASQALAQSPVPELPDFKYVDGWLGADGAYSVPLAPDRRVWLFGDTFVGINSARLRNESKTMIRNSVGISHCEPKQPCTLEYFWQRPAGALPRSFFDSGKEEIW